MKRFALLAVAIPVLLLGAAVRGDDAGKTLGTIERLDPAFDKLVPKDAKLEILAGGSIWVEGPCWIKDGGFIAFLRYP